MMWLYNALFGVGMWLHRNGRIIAVWSLRRRMKHKKRKAHGWVTVPAVDLN